jgi:hypothetical protein
VAKCIHIPIVTEVSGGYRLEVQPVGKCAVKRPYKIIMRDLRRATPEDQVRAAAEEDFNQSLRSSYSVSKPRRGDDCNRVQAGGGA